MTSKEALERLNKHFYLEAYSFDPNEKSNIREYEIIKQDLDRLEKLEKVIEILKDKFIHHFIRYSKSLTEYNKFIRDSEYDELTQEEYELLKEVI